MKIKKLVVAAMAVALVLSLTACAKNEHPSGNSGGTENSQSSSTPNISSVKDDASTSEPVKELDIWDVLPEIPVTDASAFEYKYDGELGGMVITNYLKESPKVHIPDTLEGEPVVGVNFEKELTELIIPDSVTYIGDSTLNCTSFKGIYVSQGNLNYRSIDGILFNKDKTTIIRFPPKNGLTSYEIPGSVTAINSNAFNSCKNLTSVTIPDSVTKIGKEAFSRCTSLTSGIYKSKNYDYDHIDELYIVVKYGESGLQIENGVLETALLKNITEVVIPNSVIEISNEAFKECKSLISVTIPDSVTKIGYGVFSGCTSLTNVTIGNNLTEINDGTFYYCTSLTSITIPESVTKIGGDAFFYCTSLTSVTIPDSITEIGDRAFSACKNLTSITIPSSVTEIESCTFQECTSLTSVTIENGVKMIDEHAFIDCTSLTSITIPDSVTKISTLMGGAFDNCTSLTNATYKGKTYDYEHRSYLYKAINGYGII